VWVYGRAAARRIVIHSRKEGRYQCKRCGKTFSATTQTPFYRIHKPHVLVVIVVTLLAFGCPVQAIVAAFGVDERTAAAWQRRAGRQRERVHQHLVQAGAVTLGQVQADGLRVRIVGGIVWLAMSISVASRLWLDGVVSATRDRALIRAALTRVQQAGPVAAVLLCTDGLVSYPRQALRLFRQPGRTGGRERPRLVLPPRLLIAQAIKRYAWQCGVSRDAGDGNGGDRHRLHRTAQCDVSRPARLAGAAQSGDGAAGGDAGGRDVAGRERLQLRLPHRSLDTRTPAQAAGLTDRQWTIHELLTFPTRYRR